jgi:hypothetical protein
MSYEKPSPARRMSLRLVQFLCVDGSRAVAALDDAGSARRIADITSTYELAMLAIRAGASLDAVVAARLAPESIDLHVLQAQNRLLPPIDHSDSAHLHLTGTGLTHLGSATGRDQMHQAAATGATTDSMRMFVLGLEGGKPASGEAGVQPEWFYKGDGSSIVATGAEISSPAFALEGSEEPEIAGIYLIDPAGNPRRLGFCLANEFSDHVTERGNYLWLAHSKLRPAALGAELLLGELPSDIRGVSRIVRDGETLWEGAFLTGEANMSHAIGNLEHHHFKYGIFRQPGDVHVHLFGTATLSFADGIKTQAGDIFEIEEKQFGAPLRNSVAWDKPETVAVKAL